MAFHCRYLGTSIGGRTPRDGHRVGNPHFPWRSTPFRIGILRFPSLGLAGVGRVLHVLRQYYKYYIWGLKKNLIMYLIIYNIQDRGGDPCGDGLPMGWGQGIPIWNEGVSGERFPVPALPYAHPYQLLSLNYYYFFYLIMFIYHFMFKQSLTMKAFVFEFH